MALAAARSSGNNFMQAAMSSREEGPCSASAAYTRPDAAESGTAIATESSLKIDLIVVGTIGTAFLHDGGAVRSMVDCSTGFHAAYSLQWTRQTPRLHCAAQVWPDGDTDRCEARPAERQTIGQTVRPRDMRRAKACNMLANAL
ncbi:hypothetical protein [Caballeronia ptereochthonis]|uniref:hypothetical protein n=1 Tax=Caballeronia ptereochthonis TaxID=1777144 RepID=UPI0035B4FEBF